MSNNLQKTKTQQSPKSTPPQSPQPIASNNNACKDPTVIMIDADNKSVSYCLYGIFHTIMSIIGIYLSFVCNKGFHLLPVLVAVLFPYPYLIYIIGTQGTCGLIEKKV